MHRVCVLREHALCRSNTTGRGYDSHPSVDEPLNTATTVTPAWMTSGRGYDRHPSMDEHLGAATTVTPA